MKSITLVLTENDGRSTVIVIRNDTPPRIAADACRIAATQLLEEAIRAELEAERGEDGGTRAETAPGPAPRTDDVDG